eukprot:2277518-Amphidinium_carterae.1
MFSDGNLLCGHSITGCGALSSWGGAVWAVGTELVHKSILQVPPTSASTAREKTLEANTMPSPHKLCPTQER